MSITSVGGSGVEGAVVSLSFSSSPNSSLSSSSSSSTLLSSSGVYGRCGIAASAIILKWKQIDEQELDSILRFLSITNLDI